MNLLTRLAALFRRPPAPPSKPEPFAPGSCPACNGALARDGDSVECRGLSSREEVEQYLGPALAHFGRKPPPGLTFVEPCGWKDTMDGHGTRWS